MEKIHCIYAIKDLRNDDVIYIGQTIDFNTRKHNHFGNKNRPLSRYIFDNGRDNFEMFIIEELSDDVSKEERLKLESKYIEKFNTIEKGFNKHRSGCVTFDKDTYFKQYNYNYYHNHIIDCRIKHNEYAKKRYNENEKVKEYYREYNRTEKKREYYREYRRQYRLKKKLEKQNELFRLE